MLVIVHQYNYHLLKAVSVLYNILYLFLKGKCLVTSARWLNMTPYTVSPLNNKLATVQGESAFAEAVGSSGVCQWTGKSTPTQAPGSRRTELVPGEPAPAFRQQSGSLWKTLSRTITHRPKGLCRGPESSRQVPAHRWAREYQSGYTGYALLSGSSVLKGTFLSPCFLLLEKVSV